LDVIARQHNPSAALVILPVAHDVSNAFAGRNPLVADPNIVDIALQTNYSELVPHWTLNFTDVVFSYPVLLARERVHTGAWFLPSFATFGTATLALPQYDNAYAQQKAANVWKHAMTLAQHQGYSTIVVAAPNVSKCRVSPQRIIELVNAASEVLNSSAELCVAACSDYDAYQIPEPSLFAKGFDAVSNLLTTGSFTQSPPPQGANKIHSGHGHQQSRSSHGASSSSGPIPQNRAKHASAPYNKNPTPAESCSRPAGGGFRH